MGPALSCIQPIEKNSSIRPCTPDFKYELLYENRFNTLICGLILTKPSVMCEDYVYIYISLNPGKSVHIFNCIFSMYIAHFFHSWELEIFFHLFLGLQWQQVLFIL